ncbi:MAG TPA: UDP-N-acetylmuramoylalanyl-D-glutamyl-2, 6-diaminopimelate--D-alanyl-D-alanine ligase, partial [Tahibacter sp.]|nr:UDP-N-acetylmuramoylalanyl-D-glutamyl-2, 6-diaminopimelate--D-alanyl-D-alanine ligase [Tahibacter sp.]
VRRLYATGDLSRAAVQAFGDGGRHFGAQAELIDALRADLHAGVCCLVKGSRSSAMDRVVKALLGAQGDSHAA